MADVGAVVDEKRLLETRDCEVVAPDVDKRRRLARLKTVHFALDLCNECPQCPKMIGPVVHGPAILSRIMLIGQAPGPREGGFGRPFAWTAGKTLFKWFQDTIGCTEEAFRENVYMAAVTRCFPGKAPGGGDRRPDVDEIESCRPFLEREAAILRPTLILPVGQLAIVEVLGESAKKRKLDDIVGKLERVNWHGHEVDVIPLPHPSGASPWHKLEPGKTLLEKGLHLVKTHPTIREAFAR